MRSTKDIEGLRFRAAVIRLVVVNLVWACVTLALTATELAAQPAPDSPGPPLRVVLEMAPSCAQPDEQASLEQALRVRLPDLVLQRSDSSGSAVPRISWEETSEGRCELTLTMASGVESLPLGPDATEPDLRAAAVRLAWWLEMQSEDEPMTAAPSAELPQPPSASAPEPPPENGPEPTTTPRRSSSVEITAQFGVSWYPTPGGAAGVVRILASIPIAEDLQIGLEGRLGTELSVRSEVEDVDMFERSLGLLARYQDRVGDRWVVDVSLGFRYALPQLDTESGAEAEIDRSVSNLMLVTGVGGGFDLTPVLRLKADLLGAVSVSNRRIVSSAGRLGDLGVFNLDAVLGFELSF